MKIRYKIGAVLASLGAVVATAIPAQAAPVFDPVSKVCENWDNVGTGYIKIFVDRYIDLDPNPIKSRPTKIAITNHYNHPVRITDVEYWRDSDDAGPMWWTFDDLILAAEGSGSLQSAVTSPLPRVELPTGAHTNYWWSRTGNNDSTYITNHGPVNQPWWQGHSSDGPYVYFRATSQGVTAGCLIYT